MKSKKNHSHLPEFISKHLDFYLDDLIKKNNNGKHLVLGKRPSVGDINLQNNDYLDISNHSKIVEHHVNSMLNYKSSPVMSGIFLRDKDTQPVLEKKMADYVGFKSCLLTQSGWTANISLLQTICSDNTTVYIDFFAHMSLWEGAKIAGAKIYAFRHNDINHLRKLIKRYGQGIVLVDSIYSTIGTIAPLENIVTICKEHDCAIVVDESHSLGTHGCKGSGLVNSLKLTSQVDFLTASLAKTFAYRAGAIFCNNQANECIPFVAYPSIFSSAMLPFELDRLEKTMHVIKKKDKERNHLHRVSKYIRDQLLQLGLTIKSDSQIIAIETGSESNTEKVRDFFEDNGIFGSVFCRPATPCRKNIIRLSINSSITYLQANEILEVCEKALKEKVLN
ncbi:CAI-1 autoinducer synthase [Vibrio zhanjiangensis]|uniref:CAI-1 autoinducer synthase n=1 Tax=Vibrio zhanjiangensis TaxID=1046128 RepID=A0ABQ6F3V3_9VIBR|nr:alpha-hydroxyketone-type quorum-sensing autoinducer synthase [Vibrio zhanjiangensis]GLT19896.1 CAI-1 autoinducer synthase [Vibrio zhanjiangensis]